MVPYPARPVAIRLVSKDLPRPGFRRTNMRGSVRAFVQISIGCVGWCGSRRAGPPVITRHLSRVSCDDRPFDARLFRLRHVGVDPSG